MASIVEKIWEWGKKQPDKMAVIYDMESVTYGELAVNICKVVDYLRKTGVKQGDRIIIAAQPGIRFCWLYFAIHAVGAVAVPVEKSSTEKSIASVRKLVEPAKVYLDLSQEQNIWDKESSAFGQEEPGDEIEAELLADILFTTGTTGKQKGVMLSHGNMLEGAWNVIEGGSMKSLDVNLIPVPLYHAYGLTTLRATLYCGATAVLQDGFSSIRKMHTNIHTYKCTCAYLVPSAIHVLEKQTRGNLPMLLGTLEKIEFCTAPLDKKQRKYLMEMFPKTRIYNSYGATEAARTVYLELAENPDKLESIGHSVSRVNIFITDEKGNRLPPYQTGLLSVSGGVVMKGYYNDDSLTQSVIRNGIFYSSDLAYIDEEGFIYLQGRQQDIMNIGGEKVAPSEIEDLVCELSFIQECACVSVPDPKEVRGEIPVLFVVTKDKGQDVTVEIMNYLKGKLEKYKCPEKFFIVTDIPKNNIGKYDRNMMREMALGGSNDW